MSVKERVKKFIKAEGLQISQFESSIGASNGYVNSISRSVGVDKIMAIIEKYPNINIDWLMTGRGEMYLNTTEELENSEVMLLEETKTIYNADQNTGADSEIKSELMKLQKAHIELQAKYTSVLENKLVEVLCK